MINRIFSGDYVKDPLKWFGDAVESKKYRQDVINEVNSCTSNDGFDYDKFMIWVSKQIEIE